MPRKPKPNTDPVLNLLPECPDNLKQPAFGFLHAITSNPRDDTARLVMADWMEESDHPLLQRRARLVRIGYELRAHGVPEPSLEMGEDFGRRYGATVHRLCREELELLKVLARPSGGGYVSGFGCEVNGRLGCVRGTPMDGPESNEPAVMNDRGFPSCVWAPLAKVLCGDCPGGWLPLTCWHVPEYEPIPLRSEAVRGVWWCFAVSRHPVDSAEAFPFEVPSSVLGRMLSDAGEWGPRAPDGVRITRDGLTVAWEGDRGLELCGFATREAARAKLDSAMAWLVEVCRGTAPMMFSLFPHVAGEPMEETRRRVVRLSAKWLDAVHEAQFYGPAGVEPLRVAPRLNGTGFLFDDSDGYLSVYPDSISADGVPIIPDLPDPLAELGGESDH